MTQERKATIRIDHETHIELRFIEASHQAVDDLIAHLIDIVISAREEQTTRIFINSRLIKHSQSISYLLGKLRENQKHFVINAPTRIAVTFNLLPLASLLDIFVRSLYSGKLMFKAFSVHDEVRALEWLASE